ncbi:MAG TPA: hypothetical protein VM694_23855 [Polyangium sp.]|nr:hypothetical protein [Polyangium sp.]
MGTAQGSEEEYDRKRYAYEPLLIGLSGDYMRSFGLVRAGVGLRYTYTEDGTSRGPSGNTFAQELGIYGLLGLGITTRGGVDIAATLGLGLGYSWMPRFDLYAPNWGGGAELLISVAIPAGHHMDFLVRSGAGIAYYTNYVPPSPEGVWPRSDPYLLRIHLPIELGFRKRF